MDHRTKTQIDKITKNLLKETGSAVPPIRIEPLLEHLNLYRGYYDLEDPTFLQEIKHNVQIRGRKLASIVEKIKLLGMWLPDRQAILIDSSIPQVKKKWASFHDLSHSVLPWHRDFFLGDTAQTLEPSFQEQLEGEANFSASALMFGGDLFTKEALDTDPTWEAIAMLKRRYDTSWVTTLRRYVQFSHKIPMAMITSIPWWEEVPEEQETRLRRYVPSDQLLEKFPSFSPESILPDIATNTRQQRGGLVGEFGFITLDANRNRHEFFAQCFFNTHYLITMIVHQHKLNATGIILPGIS